MFFEDFLQLNNVIKSHALLLVSTQFEAQGLPNDEFYQFIEKFCKIYIKNDSKENFENEFYHPDVLVIDRSRTILRLEDIETIKDFCLYQPQIGTYRVVFIDRVERLNLNSANFILKSLEEPSSNVIFLFTTANKHLMLPTILSRLQVFYVSFRNFSKKNFMEHFDAESKQFVQNLIFEPNNRSLQVEKLNDTNQKSVEINKLNIFFGRSLTNIKNFYAEPKQLSNMLINCEHLSKKYPPEQLRGLILHWVSERLKKDRTFVIIARFIMAHIRAWKNAEQLNPSSQLWLLKIFLGQHI